MIRITEYKVECFSTKLPFEKEDATLYLNPESSHILGHCQLLCLNLKQ